MMREGRGYGFSRIRRVVVLLIFAYLVLELGSFVALWLLGLSLNSDRITLERRNIELEGKRSGAVAGVIHPFLGYVEVPPSTVGIDPGGNLTEFPVSDFGFIGRESPVQKRSSDEWIVGVTGGSVALYFSQYGTADLERLLTQDGPLGKKRIRFINLAAGGFKQPQQLVTLTYLLSLGAEFDAILNIDGFNEVTLFDIENATKGVYPSFPRNWYNRVTAVNDGQLEVKRNRWQRLSSWRTSLAQAGCKVPLRYSAFFTILWKAADTLLFNRINQIATEYHRLPANKVNYVASGPPVTLSREAVAEFLVKLWYNSSVQMKRICEENGIMYFHFLQPNQYVPGSKKLSSEEVSRAFAQVSPYRPLVETRYPMLGAAGAELRRAGVWFHDLTDIYAAASNTVYIDTCCHVNGLGNSLLASAIASRMEPALKTQQARSGAH